MARSSSCPTSAVFSEIAATLAAAGDEGLAQVLEQESRARRLGIDGVPCFVIGGRAEISGAQPPEVIAAALRPAVRGP